MYRKCIFIIPCLALTLAACASTGGGSFANTNESMLVIGATLHKMDDSGKVYDEQYLVTALSVKNITIGHVYNIGLEHGHAISTMPAGTYCINSISSYSNVTLDYCGKPFFKLDSSKIVVTGYFVFAVDYPSHSYKLVDAFVNQQGLADSLTSMEKDALERFVDNHKAGSN